MPVMSMQLVKNFFSRPATRPYPYEQRPPFPEWRGEIAYDAKRCVYCGICANICPANAIHMEEDREHLLIKRVFNSYSCIYCGRCAELCPNRALAMDTGRPRPTLEKSTDVSSSKA